MNVLIFIELLLIVIAWYTYGFGIAVLCSLIATLLFCARKIGYFCLLRTLVGLEVTGLVLSLVFSLVFSSVDVGALVTFVVVRVIAICMYVYDSKAYVYVKKEERDGVQL